MLRPQPLPMDERQDDRQHALRLSDLSSFARLGVTTTSGVTDLVGAMHKAMHAALNGVLGDPLAATGNPLALPMRLHHAGEPLMLRAEALADARHSSQQLRITARNDWCWSTACA